MLIPPRPDPNLDEELLEGALRHANLPALLMVVYQLTGDERWLNDPYVPKRRFGMDPNDSGGFSDEIQAEVRDAAKTAIVAWAHGKPVAVPAPRGQLLIRMMSNVVSEPVPLDYEVMFATQMRFASPPRTGTPPIPPGFSVAVIGAGLGGLMAAIRLKEASIPFTVLERNPDVGGVWWNNTYPGAGVDTPSYLYSFSFFPKNWKNYFVKQDEILAYIKSLADHFELRPSIRFGVEVLGGDYDEDQQRWVLRTRDSDGREESVVANSVVSAVGIFSQPRIPDLPGLHEFEGRLFHSARWPADVDVTGKKVALVGTGASSMQILPAIVDKAAAIDVFQRSPGWVAPVSNYFDEVPDLVHWLMDNVPYYHDWYRMSLAWTFNDKLHPALQIDPDWPDQERTISRVNERHRRGFTAYITEQLEGRPDLIEKTVPDYPPWGKRMLIDNGWYAALKRPNVQLFTEAVTRLTRSGVVTASGIERPTDIVVMSTGFETTRYLFPMELKGRGGIGIRETWEDDNARAYMGITTPGFPNLFMVYGPNTNGSGGSFLSWSESQVEYIVQLLQTMIRDGIGAIEPRLDVHEAYNRRVDEAHARMIWTHPRLTTYYRNRRGRVVVNTPWRVIDTWRDLREVALDDYLTEPVKERAGCVRVGEEA